MIYKMLKVLLLICFSNYSFAFNYPKKSEILVYTAHIKSPYIEDFEEKKGLYFDLLNMMNKNSELFEFKIRNIPRKRLNKYLETGELKGIVIGANPIWYNDTFRKKYLWSKEIFLDKDIIISSKQKAFEYVNAKSSIGKVFVGVRGYHYKEIDKLEAQNLTKRFNVNDEKELLKMVLRKQIDFAIIGDKTYKAALIKNNKLSNEIHISSIDFSEPMYRYFLIPFRLKKHYIQINELISNTINSNAWDTRCKRC